MAETSKPDQPTNFVMATGSAASLWGVSLKAITSLILQAPLVALICIAGFFWVRADLSRQEDERKSFREQIQRAWERNREEREALGGRMDRLTEAVREIKDELRRRPPG